MCQLHEQYPDYAFAENKGYGTPEHLAGFGLHGRFPIDRRSFEPVRQLRSGLG